MAAELALLWFALSSHINFLHAHFLICSPDMATILVILQSECVKPGQIALQAAATVVRLLRGSCVCTCRTLLAHALLSRYNVRPQHLRPVRGCGCRAACGVAQAAALEVALGQGMPRRLTHHAGELAQPAWDCSLASFKADSTVAISCQRGCGTPCSHVYVRLCGTLHGQDCSPLP